ncbi:hypothetical protein [Enterococcus rivorum]|uniref:DUF2187 domain-containing protein n=1 Tax=Enterococcus rivorum TaxID=762845 RepID=A0A1E5KWB4_9ENTE|nr:hypothetical protein [Enterococcus rivorum]MBP2100552.1 hypothetical protein [Enterococcus rivorum]OEH82164.1 hypothetical protein BCR26_14290 [Enterococcus rivorum]
MKLQLDDQITTFSIHGEEITGRITAIYKYTLVVTNEFGSHLTTKKYLTTQGYSFPIWEKKHRITLNN